jgi:hypothetical protein
MRGVAVLLSLGLLMTQGCVVVAVGAVAGAAAGITYTVMGTAEKTFDNDYDSVVVALNKALVGLDIKTGNTRKIEDSGKLTKTEIEAYSKDLTIQITVERVSDKATRVVVDASKHYVVKDKATAAAILTKTTENLPKAA